MKLIIFCMFLFNYSLQIYPCTVIRDYPKTIDSNEYVFIGKVENYIGPFSHRCIRGESYGILVKITDTIYLPFNETNTYEVFNFGLDANCQRYGLSKEDYEKLYPIGCEVRVIGKVPTEYEYIPTKGNVMIETWIYSGSLVRNFNDYDCYSSSQTEYNYKNYFKKKNRSLTSSKYIPLFNFSDNIKNHQYLRSFEEIVFFEIKKDLIRLYKESDERKKEKIILRLIHCYKNSSIDNMLNKHFRDKKIKLKIKEKHAKI